MGSATLRWNAVPFKSEKQKGYLFANKPEVAKKFAEEEKRMAGKKKPAKREKPDYLKSYASK